MVGIKVCTPLYRRLMAFKRLAILSVFTVCLLVMGHVQYKLVTKTSLANTVGFRSYAADEPRSHPAENHKINKFTKTGHGLPLAEQKLTPKHTAVKRGLNLTTNKHIHTTKTPKVSTATEQHPSMREAETPKVEDQIPYRYLINEPHLCLSFPYLYIINIVPVAPQDHQIRTIIRRLWGNETWTNITGFKTVFLLGYTKDADVMATIREESDTHHDIIQFSFLDSYNNLTLKILSGLHWVENFCPTPVWVLKSDTDTFINVFALTRYLHTYDETTNRSRSQFVCQIWRRATPCRPPSCQNSKLSISWQAYPHSVYPTYCNGPGYILPRRMAGPLYRAANKTHPFYFEDIYYTGILPEQLHWHSAHASINKLVIWRPTRWTKSFATTVLMILEINTWIDLAASFTLWHEILRNQGINSDLPEDVIKKGINKHE